MIFPVSTNINIYLFNAREILSFGGFIFGCAYFAMRFRQKQLNDRENQYSRHACTLFAAQDKQMSQCNEYMLQHGGIRCKGLYSIGRHTPIKTYACRLQLTKRTGFLPKTRLRHGVRFGKSHVVFQQCLFKNDVFNLKHLACISRKLVFQWQAYLDKRYITKSAMQAPLLR